MTEEKTFKEKIKELVRNTGRSSHIAVQKIEELIKEDDENERIG